MPTARFLSLSARLVRDERNHTAYIDGILEDVTAARKQEAGREALIEKLQASLLFLHEPIARLGRDVVICDMDTSIEQLSRLMTARNVTAALVSSENSAVIGIVTDHDLRARVLAENIPPSTPVHTIMSAPLTKIPEHALIYEALMRMEEKGVRHLAVEDRRRSDCQRDRQQIADPVPALRPDRAGARDFPLRHPGRSRPLLRAHPAAGQDPHGQQRPPAACDQYAGFHLRCGHRAAGTAGHRRAWPAARRLCLYRHGQPGPPGTNPGHRPG